MRKAAIVGVMFGVVAVAPASAQQAACGNLSGFQWKNCMAKEIDKIGKAIDKKVADICAKQVAKGGSMGSAAADERLICRAGRMQTVLNGVF